MCGLLQKVYRAIAEDVCSYGYLEGGGYLHWSDLMESVALVGELDLS